MSSILFVCLGNICRSPAAEGVFIHYAKQRKYPKELRVESCGLGDWHAGKLPDVRMREVANDRGIVLVSRAKAFHSDFFDEFDYILAADQSVLFELFRWAKTTEHQSKIHLMTKFSRTFKNEEIPDPYYHDRAHFELVMDMLEDACLGLIEHLEDSGK